MASAHIWERYLRAGEAVRAMYDDCARATRSIKIEQFIFLVDSAGEMFAELLIKQAQSGVQVSLIVDGGGSFNFIESPLAERMEKAGVRIQYFNPISAWRLHTAASWYFRNHRKITVVDGRVGYTGGVGIRGDVDPRRDTHVRIEGPVVAELEYAFDTMWEAMSRGRRPTFKKVNPQASDFHFLTNHPRPRQRFYYRELLSQIRRARISVDLTTPYFVPDLRFFRALRAARRRGVRVRLIITEESDWPIVDRAGRSYFTLALRWGIEIYLYTGGFIHAKTAIVDNDWASVGSFNLDSCSFLLNYEANLTSTNETFVQTITRDFEEDLRSGKQIDRKLWHQRPLLDKCKELLTWPIHKFL